MRVYYLWLNETDFQTEICEWPRDRDGRDKYLVAYEIALQHGKPCEITDETGCDPDERGATEAVVHPSGEVRNILDVVEFTMDEYIKDLPASATVPEELRKLLRERKSFYLWLAGEFDSELIELPSVPATQDKFVEAYAAAHERGCPCEITDETGLSDEQSGPVIATVHPDGEVFENGSHKFWMADYLKTLPATVRRPEFS